MKSMIAELTDETNMAQGFALIPVTWAIGGTLGFDKLLLFFLLWLIFRSLGPSLAACYRGPRIGGQISSRILFGANTHISCHVSPLLHVRACHFALLQFS